ncbi:MAG: hypothetical protein ACK6BG_15210 [Cyanobacteriota bacterium]
MPGDEKPLSQRSSWDWPPSGPSSEWLDPNSSLSSSSDAEYAIPNEALQEDSALQPPPTEGTRNFVLALQSLSQITIAILIVSVLESFFPVQPWQPLWYLKIGQIAVDYSVTLLFSLFLILLSLQFRSAHPKFSRSLFSYRRFCTIVIAIYILLVPAQILSYGLHWIQTSQRDSLVIKNAEQQAALLRKRILASTNLLQLREVMEGQPAPDAPQGDSPKLMPEQKKALIDSLKADATSLRIRLNTERQQNLSSLAVNTSKSVVGSGLIAFGVARLRRLEPS